MTSCCYFLLLLTKSLLKQQTKVLIHATKQKTASANLEEKLIVYYKIEAGGLNWEKQSDKEFLHPSTTDKNRMERLKWLFLFSSSSIFTQGWLPCISEAVLYW